VDLEQTVFVYFPRQHVRFNEIVRLAYRYQLTEQPLGLV